MPLGIDCKKCSEAIKAINGCEEDSTMGERWVLGDYKLKRCPIKEMTTEGLEYLQAYKLYKSGAFPGGNDWLGWVNKFFESIQIIDWVLEKIIKEVQNKNK